MKAILSLIIFMAFTTFRLAAQSGTTKVIFNEPIMNNVQEIDFFEDSTNTMLINTEKDYYGYFMGAYKQIFHNKHPLELFEHTLPLRDYMTAHKSDDTIIIQNQAIGKEIFRLNQDDESVSWVNMTFDRAKDNLIVFYSSRNKSFRGTLIDFVNLKTWRVTRAKFRFYGYMPNSFRAIPGTNLYLFSYFYNSKNGVSIVNNKGELLQNVGFDRNAKVYFFRNSRTFLTYDSTQLIKKYLVNIVNTESATIEKPYNIKTRFRVGHIYDNNAKNNLLLIDARTYGDSIFNSKIQPRKDTIINGKKRRTGTKQWWTTSTYVYDLNTNKFKDSVEANESVRFVPNAEKLTFVQEKASSLFSSIDTTAVVVYDLKSKQYQKYQGSNVSKVKAMDYYPSTGLLATITEDLKIQVTNLRTSNTASFQLPDTILAMHKSFWRVKGVSFSSSGEFLAVNFGRFTYFFKSNNLSFYHFSYNVEECTRMFSGNSDDNMIMEFKSKLASFDVDHKKYSTIFDKTSADSSFNSKGEDCYLLSDSLILVLGKAPMLNKAQAQKWKIKFGSKKIPSPLNGMRIINLRNNKVVFSFVLEKQVTVSIPGSLEESKTIAITEFDQISKGDKLSNDWIRWVDIDLEKRTFKVITSLGAVIFDYNKLSKITQIEADRKFFPSEKIQNSKLYFVKLDEDYSNYSVYKRDQDGKTEFVMNIPSLFTNEDDFDLINPINKIMDIGNDFLAVINEDGLFQVYDLQSKRVSFTQLTFKDNTWINYSPIGYFDISFNLLPKVSWFDFTTRGCFNFDFAYNEFFQPDLISQLYLRSLKSPPFDIGYYLKIPSLRDLENKSLIYYTVRDRKNYACFSKLDDFSLVNLKKYISAAGLGAETGVNNNGDFMIKIPDNAVVPEKKTASYRDGFNLDSLSEVTHKKRFLYYASIGIGRYKSGSNLPELSGTARSLGLFQNILAKYDMNIRNVYDSVFYWKPLADSAATRTNILAYLGRIIQTLKEDDALVIYFCGHGVIPSQSELFYFLPYDAQLKNKESIIASTINTATLVDFVRFLKTKKIVIMIDACQSGGSIESMRKVSSVKPNRTNMQSKNTGSASVNILASSAPYSFTYQSEKENSFLLRRFDSSISSLLANNEIITMEEIVESMQNDDTVNPINGEILMFSQPSATFNLLRRKK
ncbi:caspase family protein [Mucilaginibacter pocheonensis]|uniref:Peptidase C14 caspase domain-containing protein n=1 Tax=Mucilaginibacter pocheonensis TaxID=398050 RepID=A0ABU1TEF1_9SPHI|nr:caspase family protein [Mucilaginibacter pocheonensis]MDR6943788.1 hypothetical protein [Mucilaginibacter pocheonensis]